MTTPNFKVIIQHLVKPYKVIFVSTVFKILITSNEILCFWVPLTQGLRLENVPMRNQLSLLALFVQSSFLDSFALFPLPPLPKKKERNEKKRG